MRTSQTRTFVACAAYERRGNPPAMGLTPSRTRRQAPQIPNRAEGIQYNGHNPHTPTEPLRTMGNVSCIAQQDVHRRRSSRVYVSFLDSAYGKTGVDMSKPMSPQQRAQLRARCASSVSRREDTCQGQTMDSKYQLKAHQLSSLQSAVSR